MQGVGTVFQFVGVGMFVIVMGICFASSLLSKNVATRGDWATVGLHLPDDPPDRPSYSAQRATTVSVMAGVFFGMALAGIGLGLQAQNRGAPILATAITLFGVIFWTVQTWVFTHSHLLLMALACGGMFLLFAACAVLAIGALNEMRRNPPPASLGVLPKDYKVPYSHLHADPPEVRLAAELEQRRRKLAIQQKELEMLEEKVRRHLKPKDD